MSLQLNVQIRGVQEVLDAFGRYQSQIKPAVNRALGDAVGAIAVTAQSYAPVRTGRLRESIHAEPVGEMGYRLSAEAPYALFVEYGTYRMQAQPFMRPAILEGRQLLLEAAFTAIQEAFS